MPEKVRLAYQKYKPLLFPESPKDYTDAPARKIRQWHKHKNGLAWMQCEYIDDGKDDKRDGRMV